MSALVGYASSEEEDDVQPEKPAKKAKLNEDSPSLQQTNEVIGAQPAIATANFEALTNAPCAPIATPEVDSKPLAPTQGPSVPVADPDASPSEPPLSPYTTERLRVTELTMPPVPNFDIPEAPPPPPANSEEAAVLAATTKKFERFLELKKQGVHFNERLQNSASLRNPSLLPKLMEFAGLSQEDSYASTLPEGAGGVPVKWPEECYVESLMKQNERKEKKRLTEREKVDFVPPASKTATPISTGTPSNSVGRKSRFDRR